MKFKYTIERTGLFGDKWKWRKIGVDNTLKGAIAYVSAFKFSDNPAFKHKIKYRITYNPNFK